MKTSALLLVSAIALACAASDATQRSLVAPSTIARAYNDPSRIDTVGMPDLIVDGKATANHWRVKNEIVADGLCSAIEGGVTPGDRRLLRFTVTTPNIGDADNYIGNPREHFAAGDGLFELDTCHGHFHFKHYATYRLIDAKTGQVWRAAKRGFCMLDTDPYLPDLRDAPRNYWSCGLQNVDGFQGISKGWNDTYVWKLGGQYFVLDGGDGQAVVPAGNYYIEVVPPLGWTLTLQDQGSDNTVDSDFNVESFRTGIFAWTGLVGFWIPAAVFGTWYLVMTWVLLRAIAQEAATATELELSHA